MMKRSSPSRVWIEELIAVHADEADAREILIRLELDPRFQITRGRPIERAMTELFRFAFSTIPDRCELFVASARSLASVSSLESGSLTLRWQAAGREPDRSRGSVTAIRPIAGDAQVHVESRSARRLIDAFHEADWDIELLGVNDDREIWAHALTRDAIGTARPD